MLSIECEITSLHLAIKLIPGTSPLEVRLVALEHAYEDRSITLQNNEAAMCEIIIRPPGPPSFILRGGYSPGV